MPGVRAAIRNFAFGVCAFLVAAAMNAPALSSDFTEPWHRKDRALVIDAYEYNPLDWQKLATNKRLTGFINKGSDGLPPPYHCSGDETEIRLCKALWKRYSVARELYHTRKTLAKSYGLKWGVYHLGRPGNPVDQANHLIDFAEPDDGDLIAIDIEGNDPEKWMSFNDAEIFARHIKFRVGRYPVLYTNGITARFIADNRLRFPLLSRLPLWYARYKPGISEHFPKGNWETYVLWQFSSNINCSKRRCPYRIAGTPTDIDINVAAMTPKQLRKAWPFGDLIEPNYENLPLTSKNIAGEIPAGANGTIPLPISRDRGLAGPVSVVYAAIVNHPSLSDLAHAYLAAGNRHATETRTLARDTVNEAALKKMATAYDPMRRRAPMESTPIVLPVRDRLHTLLDEYVASLGRASPSGQVAAPRVDRVATSAVNSAGRVFRIGD